MTGTLETLLVEDDATFVQIIQRALWGTLKFKTARNLETARRLLKDSRFDLVLLDKNLPDGLGTHLIPEIKHTQPRAAILVLTSDRLDDSVLDALAAGASDYLHKSEHLAADLLGRIRVAQQRVFLERRLEKAEQFAADKLKAEMVGSSSSLVSLKDAISVFGPRNVNFIISGPTGTGKELVARAVNRAFGDPGRHMVAINCGAIAKDLIESELFGHAKGGFTGATSSRPGRIEQADGGDLFLDEIGELPLSAQARLLRVLSTGTYSRVGEDELRSSSFRIIGATNRDLKAMISEGTFRDDLYYRLACVELETTPLRARTEDIPPLVEHFLRLAEGNRFSISVEALHWLQQQNWPGNVRELENVVMRGLALAKARESNILGIEDLTSSKGRRISQDSLAQKETGLPGLKISLPPTATGFEQHIQAAKRDYLQKAMHSFDGNLVQTAAALGLHLSTLYRYLSDLGIPHSQSKLSRRNPS